MIKLINKKGKIDKVVTFIGHPITEMVCAFIIDINRISTITGASVQDL